MEEVSPRSLQFAAAHTSPNTDDVDKAFDAVLEEMLSDKDYIWTSVEIYSNYRSHNGEIRTLCGSNALSTSLVFGDVCAAANCNDRGLIKLHRQSW